MKRFVFLFAFFAAGCGNYHDSKRAAAVLNLAPFKTMGFAASETLIFAPNCVGCHGARSGNAGGINLETFEATLPHLAQIRAAVEGDVMPLGGPALSPLEKQILFAWIDAGGPETSNLPLTN